MTFRLFIDEVGNSDLGNAATDPNVRYLALTGILTTRDYHDRILAAQLDRIKSLIPGRSTDNPIVLHRREIVRREGRFAVLRDPQIGDLFNEGLLKFIEYAPYLVITVQIDKKMHQEMYGVWRFHPYHYCMQCLVERYVMYLRRHNQTGDVVVEPRGKRDDKKLKESFERIYERGTENISQRLAQVHLSSKNLHFGNKSENIAGLQLADLIAHPSARYMRMLREGSQQPEDFGSKVVEILLRKKYARNPASRTIDGWGLKWLPK